MKRIVSFIIVFAFSVLVICPAAFAQDVDMKAILTKMEKLEQDNQKLQNELAGLREELNTVKAGMAKTQAAPAAASSPGPVSSVSGAAVSAPGTASPSTAAPAVTPAADWTQNIKFKGDVRFRTRTDAGKSLAGTNGHAPYRIYEQVRARLGAEAKVNDQITGGIRIATGDSNTPKSANQTLDNFFTKKQLWIDLMYVTWYPKFEPLKDSSFWAGKIDNPIERTDLTWDSDINPEGAAFKYMSPALKMGDLPAANFYGNFGMFWLDEISSAMTDAMMWVWQGGVKMPIYEKWGTNLNFAFAYYINTHVQRRAPSTDASALTNTVVSAPGDPTNNTLRYAYDMLDFVAKVDNKKLFDWNVGSGLWGDFLFNPCAPKDNLGFGTGAYLGMKKPEKQYDWQLYGDFRLLQRDSIMDTLVDQDFYGFRENGQPSAGGTGAYGFKCGITFAILKNTLLDLSYWYQNPIKKPIPSSGVEYDGNYQHLIFDILVRF